MSRLLSGIRADADALTGLRAVPRASLLADVIALSGMKYLFVTAIEGCAKVAHHLAASEAWRVPDSNADAMRLLGLHGVIPADLGDRLGKAVGFRNLLVHQYGDIDDRMATAHLDDVGDFRTFVAHVGAWVNGRP